MVVSAADMLIYCFGYSYSAAKYMVIVLAGDKKDKAMVVLSRLPNGSHNQIISAIKPANKYRRPSVVSTIFSCSLSVINSEYNPIRKYNEGLKNIPTVSSV